MSWLSSSASYAGVLRMKLDESVTTAHASMDVIVIIYANIGIFV
jgi:hypothetical protein